MRINNNIPALQTFNSIRQANRATQNSMLRLSTGFKINSAKDDAAGLAISNKMRMQINGLEMAGRNAMDGVSLVQTADGALSEVHNMLQRMRELAVKAANGTMEDVDREKVQQEVDALLQEIDEISNRTEFNTIKLFGPKANGGNGFDFFDPSNLTSKAVKGISTDPGFPDGDFSFEITKAGIPSQTEIEINSSTDLAGTTFAIGSKHILFADDETNVTALKKISDLAKELGYEVRSAVPSSGKITIFSQGALDLSFESTDIIETATPGEPAEILGNTATFKLASGQTVAVQSPVEYVDNQIILTLEHPHLGKKAIVQVDVLIDMDIMGNVTYSVNDGERDASGTITTPYTAVSSTGTIAGGATYKFNATYRDYSNIILQIGPNQGMEMNIHIPEVNRKTLGLTQMSYLPFFESEASIGTCDKAIAEVSKIRSKLGAYQNRLEYTSESIDITSENMSSALSRIVDTDMAKEMTFYTQQNIISQAGMSILAQANQRSQQILQLVSR